MTHPDEALTGRAEDETALRGLLQSAVADVEPRGGLEAIRSRTTAPAPTRRPWAWSVAGAVAATAATVAGVTVLSSGVGIPGGKPAPASHSPVAAGAERTVTVYFVGDTAAGPRLFSERRKVFAPVALQEALADAVQGAAIDRDYTSPWPSAAVHNARLSDGVIFIAIDPAARRRPPGMSAHEAAAAIQQVVLTAQSAVGRPAPVTFRVGARPATTVLGTHVGGSVAGHRDDSDLAPVQISSPTEGATVTSPFQVRGRAATFEANVQWELMQGGGTVVRRGFTTARRCCTLSPYSFEVSAPPGVYTLVVHDEDVSNGEGVGRSQDTKTVTVR